MTKIEELDKTLLNEVFEFQKNYIKNHVHCKGGIDFPDGSHSCKELERATAKYFKEKYRYNLLMKLEILGL